MTDELMRKAAAAAAGEATPIDDIRSTAEYRKAVTEVLVARALHKAEERAGLPGRVIGRSGARTGGGAMNKQVLTFRVNGLACDAIVTANMTLADVLREELGLTGTKESCQVGECGSCTVLVDGKPVPLLLHPGDRGPGQGHSHHRRPGGERRRWARSLHPIQQAFVDHGAIQCGFCSPGMILMAKALLDENPMPTREEVQEGLGGNLCRCTGYVKIVDAVLAAADVLSKEAGE